MDNGLLRQLFQAEIGEVDAALAARLSHAGDDGPWPHVRYHLGIEGGVMMPRGKRLRAIFCLLIGRAARTPQAAVRVLMLASELGHAASLIHDDIQDGETVRWGRPTLWAHAGMGPAIQAGDAMLAMVYEELLRLPAAGLTPARAARVIGLFSRAYVSMCQGQHLDMLYEGDFRIGAKAYLDVIGKKTAALTACAAETSAVAAGLELSGEYRRFGHAFGMLYQIADDVRDLWSPKRDTGKEGQRDLIQRKATLPLILGWERGSARLRELLADPAPIEPEFVKAELARAGVDRLCHAEVSRWKDEALDALTRAACEPTAATMLRMMTEVCAQTEVTLPGHNVAESRRIAG